MHGLFHQGCNKACAKHCPYLRRQSRYDVIKRTAPTLKDWRPNKHYPHSSGDHPYGIKNSLYSFRGFSMYCNMADIPAVYISSHQKIVTRSLRSHNSFWHHLVGLYLEFGVECFVSLQNCETCLRHIALSLSVLWRPLWVLSHHRSPQALSMQLSQCPRLQPALNFVWSKAALLHNIQSWPIQCELYLIIWQLSSSNTNCCAACTAWGMQRIPGT